MNAYVQCKAEMSVVNRSPGEISRWLELLPEDALINFKESEQVSKSTPNSPKSYSCYLVATWIEEHSNAD